MKWPKTFIFTMGPFSLVMIYVQKLKDHLVLQTRQIWGTFEQASKNFFNSYLAAWWPILGHYYGDNLTDPMLITAFFWVQPKGHQEPWTKLGP